MAYWFLTDELDALQAGLVLGGEMQWADACQLSVMAQMLAESMRAVQDAAGQWILPHRASYEVKYAALALRCGYLVRRRQRHAPAGAGRPTVLTT